MVKIGAELPNLYIYALQKFGKRTAEKGSLETTARKLGVRRYKRDVVVRSRHGGQAAATGKARSPTVGNRV